MFYRNFLAFCLTLFLSASLVAQNVGAEASRMPEASTGIFGAIDNDLGYDDEFFEKKDFSDIHGMIKNGASFEVMNTKILIHPKYSTYQVMVKIKFDPQGLYTDKVGWLDIQSTTLRNNFSTTTMIVGKDKVTDTYSSGNTSATTKTTNYANTVEAKTGLSGAITSSEVFDKKDFTTPTWGTLDAGITFDVLNTKVVSHPNYNSLNMMLIKVTFDAKNVHTGRVGWVQVNKTSLVNNFNAATMTVGSTAVFSSSTSTSSSTKPTTDFANYSEYKTGITGAIANDSGSEVFDKKDFSTTHGFVKNGATFDLLNTKTVKHPTYSLDMILIKITFDPEYKYTDKVGWVYVKATSLKNNFNTSTLTVGSTASTSTATTSTTPTSYPEFGNYKEEKTGITGSVANASYKDEVFDKKDFAAVGHGFVLNGATFDLLSRNVIKHPKYPSLYMVLIKVTFDSENKQTGKVGWVQVNNTSLKPRFNSSTMKIE